MVPKYMVIFVYILVDGSCNFCDKYKKKSSHFRIFFQGNVKIHSFFSFKPYCNRLHRVEKQANSLLCCTIFVASILPRVRVLEMERLRS